MAMFWQQIISFVSFEFPLLQFSSFIEFDFKLVSWLRDVYISQFFIYFLFKFSVTQREGKFGRFSLASFCRPHSSCQFSALNVFEKPSATSTYNYYFPPLRYKHLNAFL